jgi:hypothetical protein
LLLKSHVNGVFVGVAVQSNLVAGITDGGAVFWKGFEGVTWTRQILRAV